jgi:hypothetical protein
MEPVLRPRPPRDPAFSLLRLSLVQRLLIAGALIAVLWLAVAWALRWTPT